MAKTKIERLESHEEDVVVKAEFIKRFIDKLGDPSKFVHDPKVDEVYEADSFCVCGHPIRWCFPIRNPETKQKAIVGSECINHFASYSPALYESLKGSDETLKKKIAELKKQARIARQEKEIEPLKADYDVKIKLLVDHTNDLRAKKIWLPYPLYNFDRSPKNPPEYSKKGLYISWYKKGIKYVDRLLELKEKGWPKDEHGQYVY